MSCRRRHVRIVWLRPLMGFQTVNSLPAALLNSHEAGCGKPGQSDSGVSIVDGICTNGPFQVQCKAGEALRTYHLAGSLEAEDRIQGTCKVPGGQGQPKPFIPVGQVFDEIPNEDFPNSIVIQIGAQHLQHRRVHERQGIAVGLRHGTCQRWNGSRSTSDSGLRGLLLVALSRWSPRQ